MRNEIPTRRGHLVRLACLVRLGCLGQIAHTALCHPLGAAVGTALLAVRIWSSIR